MSLVSYTLDMTNGGCSGPTCYFVSPFGTGDGQSAGTSHQVAPYDRSEPVGVASGHSGWSTALRAVGHVPEPMGEAVTPGSGRTGPGGYHHVTLRYQGLLSLAELDNRELPRGPSLHALTSADSPDPAFRSNQTGRTIG